MKYLVTGTAGFIGFHLVQALLKENHTVVGIDNVNDYYDVNLKFNRLKETGISDEAQSWHKKVKSSKFPAYSFVRMNLEDKEALMALFAEEKFDVVVNLAAQAGVRYSIENPDAYIQANIVGFMNILEASRHNQVGHVVYASSSSVYGLNENMPFSVKHNVDHPISLYAASKKANELMAHTYSHLYQIPTTGLRFFTVYGPWGRPDMAAFIFADAITAGKSIKVFNQGNMQRDFTYVDDIVNGIVNVAKKVPEPNKAWSGKNPDPSTSKAPYRILNIGNNSPVPLMDFIHEIEKNMGKKAEMDLMDMQDGDVPATWADAQELIQDYGYRPNTPIATGIRNFIDWYKDYKKI